MPGPLSGQFSSTLGRLKFSAVNDVLFGGGTFRQTTDTRLQGVSDLHMSAGTRYIQSRLLWTNSIFLVTIYGLVSSADTALLSHENRQRLTENELRREARIDLARRGLVATESQIMKWKDEHKR